MLSMHSLVLCRHGAMEILCGISVVSASLSEHSYVGCTRRSSIKSFYWPRACSRLTVSHIFSGNGEARVGRFMGSKTAYQRR